MAYFMTSFPNHSPFPSLYFPGVSTLGVWKYGVLNLKRPRLQNRAKVSAKPDAKLKSTESETSLDVVGRIATPNLDSFFFDLHRGTAVKLRKGIPSHQFHSGILLRVYFWITCFLLGQLNRMSGFFGVFIVEIYRWGSLLFRHFLCLLSRCRHSTHASVFLMLDISKSKSLSNLKTSKFWVIKAHFRSTKAAIDHFNEVLMSAIYSKPVSCQLKMQPWLIRGDLDRWSSTAPKLKRFRSLFSTELSPMSLFPKAFREIRHSSKK